MADIAVFIRVSDVFPDSHADLAKFRRLLRQLSRTDVLFWCARINHFLTNRGDLNHVDRQVEISKKFFTPDQIRRIVAFASERDSPNATTVFFRGQLLELVRWAVLECSDAPNDGETFEDPSVRQRFVKAALTASELWSGRVFADKFSNTDDSDLVKKMTGPLRKAIEGAQRAPGLRVLGRGWSIFSDIIPTIDDRFAGRFHSATGLTVEEYFCCWTALATKFMKADSEAAIFDAKKLGSNTTKPSVVQRFLASQSQTVNELRHSLWGNASPDMVSAESLQRYDYKPIRERPIVCAADGRSIIIDPLFMMDKAWLGPLFHVTAATPTEGRHWFSVFGKAFEQYVQNILREAFPVPPAGLFDRLGCSVEGQTSDGQFFEIDACLDCGDDLILFEVKGVWLRKSDFGPDDSDRLLRNLELKFGKSDDDTKGVAQLARVAAAISDGRWLGPNRQWSNIRRVIPVLLVQDPLLGTPGFGQFTRDEFDALFGPERVSPQGERIRGSCRATAPILLSVEDLELLETPVEHFGLRDALIAYSEANTERISSFYHFLATSSEYSDQLYGSRSVAHAGSQLLRRTMVTLFDLDPDAPPSGGSKTVK